jgi:hypothetical protein
VSSSEARTPWPLRDKRPNCTSEEQLVRIVVATANQAVDMLSRTAEAHRGDHPKASDHIRQLSRAIAGMTVDALSSWPKAGS